jgi:hypothetical protein
MTLGTTVPLQHGKVNVALLCCGITHVLSDKTFYPFVQGR